MTALLWRREREQWYLEGYWGRHIVKKKTWSATNLHLNWTSCSQAQVLIRSAAEVDIEIIRLRTLSCVCEMEFCMNNKYSCESSCHHPSLYRCMSKSGKVWKLSFNAAVTQHVSIIYVTPARYWEFAWELHSELCWFLPSNDSTDSLHIWILPYKNCNVDEIID